MPEWKDGELRWCIGLIKDTSVSRNAVVSYLEVQAVSAKRDGETDISAALMRARDAIMLQDDWDGAAYILEGELNDAPHGHHPRRAYRRGSRAE